MKPDITWQLRVIDPFISPKKIEADITFSNFQNEMTAYYLFGSAKFLNIYSLQCHFHPTRPLPPFILLTINNSDQKLSKGHLKNCAFTHSQALKFVILASYI